MLMQPLRKHLFRCAPYMKTLLLILTIFLFSCQSVRLSKRTGKDLYLTKDSKALNDTFKNNTIDSSSYTAASIWQRLSNKDYKAEYLVNTTVNLNIVDQNHLHAKLLLGDIVLEERILKGKFKRGYFAVNNRLKASFTAGPLLWAFAGFKIHLGVTKENELILFESNAGSTVILVLPIFWAGSVDNMKYQRKRT